MDNNTKNPFDGLCDVGQAEQIINRYQRDNPDNIDGLESLLNLILEALYNAEQLVGDADDFHNFSVSISKIANDNSKAVYIIQEGLKIHDNSTDLLADAIKYGYSCGQKDNCTKWFNSLIAIDKSKWTWRAFSFTIEYLLNEWVSSTNYIKPLDYIFNLAKEYQKYKPDEEDAWYCEYQIYAGTNQIEKGIEILKSAIDKFTLCPRCWLRYADIMVERGEFKEAEPIIAKMRRNPKTREKINSSYMFFLDAQCKIASYYSSEAYENGEKDEKAVWAIYRAFRQSLASTGLRENIKSQIDDYILELSDESGIEFPDDWRYSSAR